MVEIEASARRHGVSDDDMLHALRNHRMVFETDDPRVSLVIGPAANAEPPEVAISDDDDGVAVIHVMAARPKFLNGWWSV